MNQPFSLIRELCDATGMDLSGFELRPPLPRAVPITQKRDGVYYMIGVRFETEAETENFAQGLDAHCDRDGRRLLFKRPWQATTQVGQAIWPI